METVKNSFWVKIKLVFVFLCGTNGQQIYYHFIKLEWFCVYKLDLNNGTIRIANTLRVTVIWK